MNLPASALRAIGDNAEGKIRLWAAVKGYELRQLNASAAAELAGMSKMAFLQKLGDFGVAVFDMSREELERDLAVALAAARPPSR